MAIIRNTAVGALVAAVGLLAAPALAQENWQDNEIALLPNYCQTHPYVSASTRSRSTPEEVKRWTSLMGETYKAIHHYCWALMATNRGKLFSRTPRERERWLRSSINDINYVLNNSTPAFVLLPEILTRKGENLIGSGKPAEGVMELQRAIQTKPDYWPPYAALSDHAKQAGEMGKAREWLEKGLAAAPDAKPLQNRLAALKGGGESRGNAAKSAGKSAKPAPPEQAPPEADSKGAAER